MMGYRGYGLARARSKAAKRFHFGGASVRRGDDGQMFYAAEQHHLRIGVVLDDGEQVAEPRGDGFW
jgi:hypothetical protein